MRNIYYYIKILFIAVILTMGAFGMVLPGTFTTRKKYADKEVTIELIVQEITTESDETNQKVDLEMF